MDFNFADYCWDFYGPGQIYGEFFCNSLQRSELDAAIDEYMLTQTADFAADSLDRERIRDIMLGNRDLKRNLESPAVAAVLKGL